MAWYLLFAVLCATFGLFEHQTVAAMTTQTLSTYESTPIADYVDVNCSSNDTFYDECLNSGHCVVTINTDDQSRSSRCECGNDYTGPHCEKRKRRVAVGSVAAGVVLTVVFLIFVVIVLVICYRKKRQPKGNTDPEAEAEALDS